MDDTMACRHCQGLVAGMASKCRYCGRTIRRDTYEPAVGRQRKR